MGLLDTLNGMQDPQSAGLLGMAQGLLAASGPSRLPVSLGQAMAGGLANSRAGQAQALQMQGMGLANANQAYQLQMAKLRMDMMRNAFGRIANQGQPMSSAAPAVLGVGSQNDPNTVNADGSQTNNGGVGPTTQNAALLSRVQASQPQGNLFGMTPQQMFEQGQAYSLLGIPGGGQMMTLAAQYDPTLQANLAMLKDPRVAEARFASGGDESQARNMVGGVLSKDATLQLRPGGLAMNYATGQTTYVPKMPDGSMPIYGPGGQITGTTVLPGAPGVEATINAARAAGQQGGKLALTPQPVYNPATGQQGVALGGDLFNIGGKFGGMFGGQPSGASAQGSTGQTSGFVPTQAPIGTATYAKKEVQDFQADQDAVPAWKNAIQSYQNVLQLLPNGTVTGPGTKSAQQWSGVLNTIGQKLGVKMGTDSNANYQEIVKNLAYANNQALSSMGMASSDAKMDQFLHGAPNPDQQNPKALRAATEILMGNQAGAVQHTYAEGQWLQSHPATTLQAFNQEWAKAYDTNAMIVRTIPPSELPQWLKDNTPKGMKPTDYAKQLAGKLAKLQALGAFPGE